MVALRSRLLNQVEHSFRDSSALLAGNATYGLLCSSSRDHDGCTGMVTALLTTQGHLLHGQSATTKQHPIPVAAAADRIDRDCNHDWAMTALLARIMGDGSGNGGATMGADWLHELFSGAPDKLDAMKAQVLGGGGEWRC